MHGVLKLRKMVQDDPDMGWRERYDAVGTEEILVVGVNARAWMGEPQPVLSSNAAAPLTDRRPTGALCLTPPGWS